MSQIIDTLPRNFTYIGEETSLQGTFVFKGDTKIAGKIKGEIRLQDSAPLCIEPTGSLDGTLYCHNLIVYGHFMGEIRSSGTVTFFPSSTFDGHIKAQNLVIHPGANIFMEGTTTGEDEEGPTH